MRWLRGRYGFRHRRCRLYRLQAGFVLESESNTVFALSERANLRSRSIFVLDVPQRDLGQGSGRVCRLQPWAVRLYRGNRILGLFRKLQQRLLLP